MAGFTVNCIVKTPLHSHSNLQIIGIDNFSRNGSDLNISRLTELGIDLIRGDIRSQSGNYAVPRVDWVIDCAANPSVLAGINGQSSSRQLLEHNLLGTVKLLEYCKSQNAGLILLSTSRIFSAS